MQRKWGLMKQAKAKTMTPEPGSKWTHENGNIYTVLLITNEHANDNERYPVTVVYQANNLIWSRPLSRWHSRMIKL